MRPRLSLPPHLLLLTTLCFDHLGPYDTGITPVPSGGEWVRLGASIKLSFGSACSMPWSVCEMRPHLRSRPTVRVPDSPARNKAVILRGLLLCWG